MVNIPGALTSGDFFFSAQAPAIAGGARGGGGGGGGGGGMSATDLLGDIFGSGTLCFFFVRGGALLCVI